MTQINQNQPLNPTLRPGAPPAPPERAVVAPARTAPVAGDSSDAGLSAVLARVGPQYQQLAAAVNAGDYDAARQAIARLKPLLEQGDRLAGTGEEAALFNRVRQAAVHIEGILAIAPHSPRPAIQAPAPAPRPAGPSGPLAGAAPVAAKLGGALEKVGNVLFAPLNLLGKVADPVRGKLGEWLGGAKGFIDRTAGSVPVLGSAVRFTTGLASSVVGLVDGAVQGITHPVELVKGLGGMAWTVAGLVPGPRTAWDMLVNGKSATESLKGAWGEGGQIVKALFEGAIEDVKAGNWAGAAGRLTGDIGSLFITGGAAAGGKAGSVGKIARVLKATRLEGVASAGARLIGGANELSAKIMSAGLKGNLAVFKGAGKVASQLPGAERAAALLERRAGKVAGRSEQAAVAAVMQGEKQAHSFSAAQLGGEIRAGGARTLEEYLAKQDGLMNEIANTPFFHEGLSDVVRGGLVDGSGKVEKVLKSLKLDGRPVKDAKQAIQAFNALPPNSPQRAEIARQIASAMQESFHEALHYPPPPIEFTNLTDNLAGLQKEGKVLIDPALLNEDLAYVMNVMAEEHVHAYQRFLTDHAAALEMPKRVAAEVEKYMRDFQAEHYLVPPDRASTRLAEGIKSFERTLKNLADSADEVEVRNLRREVAAGLPEGSAARRVLDDWYKVAKPESERLSFMKYALEDLNQAKVKGTERLWMSDYAERLPRELLERNGAKLGVDEVRAALRQAITESQKTLGEANAHVSRFHDDWLKAYQGQAVEFTAKHVASDVLQWIEGGSW